MKDESKCWDSPEDEGGSDLFSCDQCDASFVTKWSLDSHMKGFHPQPKVNNHTPATQNGVSPEQVLKKRRARERRKVNGKELTPQEGELGKRTSFPCQLCNKEFSQQDELKLHLNSAHSEVTITLATTPKPKLRSLLKRPLDMTVHEDEKMKAIKLEPKPDRKLHQIQLDGNFEITEVVRTLLISHMNAETGREAEAAAAAKKLTSLSPLASPCVYKSSPPVQSPVDNSEDDQDDEFEGEGEEDESQIDGAGETGPYMFPLPVVTMDEDLKSEFPFPCNECGASFRTLHKLDRHMEHHSSANRPFKCHLCGDSRGFVRKEHLNKHMTSVHSGMKFTCEICGKDISRRDHLVRHLRSVHRCSIPPGLDLLAASSASNIQVTVNSPEAATTSQLQLDEISDKALQSMQPKPKKPYTKCDMCDEKFTQLETLFKHQREAHSDIRKYNCDLCAKSFKRREHLQKHLVLHSGEKKFTCNFCARSFPRRDALQDHLRRIHGATNPTEDEEFPCSLCEKVFFQNSNLIRHRNQVHNITLAVAIANGPINGPEAGDSSDGEPMDRVTMKLVGNNNGSRKGKKLPGLLPIENFHFQPATAGRN